jgi:hypothetical protein
MTRRPVPFPLAPVLAGFLLVALAPPVGLACEVNVDDPEVVFPVEKMEREAVCRLASVVNDYSTHRVMPPVLTPIQKGTYDFLLDHPVLTALLVRNLALADYRVSRAGPDTWNADDGQGAEGLISPLYQDTTRRVYHIKGTHRGRFFPLITGEAIVMLNYHAKAGADGREHVETRIITYSKLDNPVLATLVRVFHPILRRVVNDKLTHAFITVHTLGERMGSDPEQVYRQVELTPEVDPADVEALRSKLLPSLKKGDGKGSPLYDAGTGAPTASTSNPRSSIIFQASGAGMPGVVR